MIEDFGRRHVLVTGAANGIGAACARKFHERNAVLTMVDVEIGPLEDLARSLASAFQSVDLRDPLQIDKLLHQISTPDIVINNAGMNIDAGFLDYSGREIQDIISINLLAPISIMRAFAPSMIANGRGVIVNVTSQLAFRGSPNRAIYGACKAAISHLTQSLAAEWGPHGVRVVGVAPGRTATRMTHAIRASIKAEDLAQSVPLGRFGTAEEIAEAVCFMASDRATYVHGSTLVVDGGFLSR